MIKTLNALFLLCFSVPVFSADIPLLESLRLADLPAAQAPAASSPLNIAPAARAGVYDYSGLPAYIFTEEGRVSPSLVTAIDRTKRTLDVALYNLQFEDTIAAMLRAKERGVKVRVIFDYDHVYPQAGKQIQEVIASGLETRVMKGRGGSGSMHCKYAIFDSSLLETGSANWSNLAEAASYENLIFTADTHIIAGYNADFEWLWAQAKTAGQPDAVAAKPTLPPADPQPSVQFNGVTLPNYIFSPRAGTTAAMVKAIDAARSEVDVAMFSFTSRPLMDALNRAAARGLQVKMLLYVKSAFPFREEAKTNRISVHYKAGRTENGIMHNKFAVLDGTLLINGSFNWSATAEDINTENTIFTTVPDYARPFKAEFDKLYSSI